MTNEEKAKAYDKALERAKKELNTCGSQDCDAAKQIFRFFPELKESEDEKIRKELLEHCINRRDGKQVCVDASDYRRWADWLEKQGEQKPNEKDIEQIDEVKKGKLYICIEDWKKCGTSFTKGKIYVCHKDRCMYDDFGVEKASIGKLFRLLTNTLIEDEQKSADKVEPRFHEGDWITNGACIIKITSVSIDGRYYWHDNDCVGGDIRSIDKEYRLWTIQDAKNGDVLADSKTGTILMFRGIGNTNWDDVIDYHCYYDCHMKDFIVQEGVEHWGNIENNQLVPSTKEQRDLLLKKMKEAGYGWDAEKKELKRIEHKFKVGDIIKYVGEREEFSKEKHTIKKILDDCYLTIDDMYIPFKFEEYYILINQNKTWSEEDEKNALDIKCLILNYRIGNGEYELCSWIDNLKDRLQPQPKQEWSEEDEHYKNGLIGLVENSKAGLPINLRGKAADKCIDWLKSLKPHWKPSEEQMEALEDAISCRALPWEQLGTLYNDLKKL